MGDSNNLLTQNINYFKVGEYLEAVRYVSISNYRYPLIIVLCF